MKTLILLMFALAAGVANAGEPIYKWVDADGNLHYSDCPPEPAENCQVEEVAVTTGPTLSQEELQRIEERRARLIRELDERERARQTREDSRREQRQARARHAEFETQQCTLARSNLEELLRAEPTYRPESHSRGEPRADDETLKHIEIMREVIARYCDD